MYQLIGLIVVSLLLMITAIMAYKKDEPSVVKKRFVIGMIMVAPLIMIGSIVLLTRSGGNRPPTPVAAAVAAPTPEPTTAKLNNKVN